MLECYGRIQGQYPVYLPAGNLITRKLVQQTHTETLHEGVSLTMAAIREVHWIPTLRQLGKLTGTKAKIYVDPKATPVPYALKAKVELELDRLQCEGILSPDEFSEWAAPIVPVVKLDRTVHICGDYKCTVNQVSKLDNYAIPKTEDLLATLGSGNQFTKLDMSQAYQQLDLEEGSKMFTTINTHKGLYQYNRLPFGVSSAPGIFQHTMENLLQGIPQVVV